MAELIFMRRDEEVMFYHIDGKKTRIGRGAENDIAFPEHELNISRYHAMVEERLGVFWLRDLSTQGLMINQKLKHETILQDEDRFELGRWEVVFRSRTRGAGKTLATQSGGTMPLASEEQFETAQNGFLSYKKGSSEQTVELGQAPFNIGSSAQNELCFDLSYISSFHCRIFWKAGKYFIRDLDSLNGVWVNGVKIVEGELCDEAEIYLGKFKLTFSLQSTEPVIETSDWPGFAGMISEDPQMAKIFKLIERMAQSDVPVLIKGGTGTGKELVARALHDLGPRKGQPFVALNCGAISRDLIESALFGHERGAFTGAVQARKGAFEEAGNGTLFLDEIGDMPYEQQVSLLRVLESQTFRRVGGSQELESRARIITATHRDLIERAHEHSFREDLFYRISVLQIQLPSLHERSGDILLLARYFLQKFSGPRDMKLSPEAEQRLLRFSWPGNVRELYNAMQNAIVMAETNTIQADELDLRDQLPAHGAAGSPSSASHAAIEQSSGRLDDTERMAIIQALESSGGIVSNAAKKLGIGRSSMYSKMKRLGIEHRNKS